VRNFVRGRAGRCAAASSTRCRRTTWRAASSSSAPAGLPRHRVRRPAPAAGARPRRRQAPRFPPRSPAPGPPSADRRPTSAAARRPRTSRRAYRFLRQGRATCSSSNQLRRNATRLPTDPGRLAGGLGRARSGQIQLPIIPNVRRGLTLGPPMPLARRWPPEHGGARRSPPEEAFTRGVDQDPRSGAGPPGWPREALLNRPLLDAGGQGCRPGAARLTPEAGARPALEALGLPRHPAAAASAHRGADLGAAPPGPRFQRDPCLPVPARLVRRRGPSGTRDCSRSARSV